MRPFAGVRHLGGPQWWRFGRHYLEMVIAMLLGMLLFAPLWHALAHSVWPALHTRAELHTLTMATDMTVAMSLWMWFRGHAWRPIAEMAAAMYLPFVLLFGPLWVGLISGTTLTVLGHTLMFVAMPVVMLARPAEYSRADHQHHRASADDPGLVRTGDPGRPSR